MQRERRGDTHTMCCHKLGVDMMEAAALMVMMEEKGVPVIRLAPHDDNFDVPLVAVLLRPPPNSSSPDTHLCVIACCWWLSSVPYFDTHLTELSPSSTGHLTEPSPSSPCTMPLLTLTCAPCTPTHAYFRFLDLLRATSESGSVITPSNFDSVHEALELLPVANHLGFDECEHACLKFLGAVPWSIEEEDEIRDILATRSIYPTGALRERLDTSGDSRSLVAMLLHLLGSRRLTSIFIDVAQKCFQSSPDYAARELSRLLSRVRAFYMSKLFTTGNLPRQWFTVTKVLLQRTDTCDYEIEDAQGIVCELVDSEALSACLIRNLSANHKGTICILTQAFEKVHKGVVTLSISQRAEVVKQYGRFSQVIKDASFNDALRGLIDTLPLNHPALLDLMKSKPKMGLIPMWFERVLSRVIEPEFEIPGITCVADDVRVIAEDVEISADDAQVSADNVHNEGA